MAVRKDKTLKQSKRTKHKMKSKKKRIKNSSNDSKSKDDEAEQDYIESDLTDVSDCEEYEIKPRKFRIESVRNLLPVKSKKGLLFRSEIVKDDTEEKQMVLEPVNAIEGNSSESSVQKLILSDLKCKVALLCMSVIEDPENNAKPLKELIELMTKNHTKMLIKEKKIVCISILHVFHDILPSYKIRDQVEKDPKVKFKKSTKKLLFYEQNLLQCYKQYIDYLVQLVQKLKSNKKDENKSSLKMKTSYDVGLVALRCLCELLSTRFSFNYFGNICSVVVPLSGEKDPNLSDVCCQSFEKLFKADKLGEASYAVVRQIMYVVKKQKFHVPPNLLKCLFSLNLKEAKREEKFDMDKARKQWHNMSRKERKQKKKMSELEAELREAEAQESSAKVKSFHTRTLDKMFWIFFHILKDGDKISLMSPALEGLSKFAYLIDLKFFDDLNTVLCGLMETGKLNDVEKLQGVYTLFTILAGQAESLHIDPYRMYCHMYEGLLKLNHHTDVEHFVLTLKCLEYNVLRKKKKLSFNRILAFAKRTSTVTLQTSVHGTLGLLSTIRCILTRIKGSDILLDSETILGSGLFLPSNEDPEHCNAQSTALWELCLLKNHYSPVVGLYAEHVLHNCPEKGKFSLPNQLSNLDPEAVLHLFADVGVLNKMDYLEESSDPPKKKFKRGISDYDFVYKPEADINISWKDVRNVNIFES